MFIHIVIPAFVSTQKPFLGVAVLASAQGDTRIDQDGKIRTRNIVNPHGGSARSKMSACRTTHHADLPDSPLLCMVTAVAEGILDIIQRNCAVMVRHPVLQDSHRYSPIGKPLGAIHTLIEGREVLIAATRSHYHHQSIRILREIEIHSGIISDVLSGSGSRTCLRAAQSIVFLRSGSYLDAIFNNSLSGSLAFWIEQYSL